MLDLSEKLKKFSIEVLGIADEKSQALWTQFEEEQRLEFDKKETEYLQSGYNTIQQGLKKIDKEKSGRLSKAMMESRQLVLQKRVEIIDQVFSDLQQKLQDFILTEKYLSLLDQRIRSTLQILGEGSKKIVLTEKDLKRVNPSAYGPDLLFEAEPRVSKGSMLGGCRGYHLEKNIFYDASFVMQIEKQKESFLREVATELKVEN